MAFKPSRYIPAAVAWILLLGITGGFYYLVIPGFVEQFKILGIVITILEMLLFISVISNFLVASVMDPGVISKATESEEQHQFETRSPMYKTIEIRGISVRMKWCVTCHFYRPPRCSHCSLCDHCINSFDHHCPWLNNCIGRRNYRYFFIFLLALCVHIICVFSFCFFYTLRTKFDVFTKENISSMVIMVLTGVIFMPVVGLTAFHMYLVARGRTTNEQVTGKYRNGFNPFSQGFCRNIVIVCFGSQFPKFDDYVGKQEVPDFDDLMRGAESNRVASTVLTISPSSSAATADIHHVHVYTAEDDQGPSGLDKRFHDGLVDYKPMKRQQQEYLHTNVINARVGDRSPNVSNISRDSSLVTLRRFKDSGGEDVSLGVDDSQGSKCNLLDENGSAFDAQLLNHHRSRH